jgi:hypothetical protein
MRRRSQPPGSRTILAHRVSARRFVPHTSSQSTKKIRPMYLATLPVSEWFEAAGLEEVPDCEIAATEQFDR